MAYKVIILYQLYMPSYFLGTFTEYPEVVTYNCLAMVIRLIIKSLRVGFSLTRRIRSLFFQLFPD